MKINIWCPYFNILGKISQNTAITNIEITSNTVYLSFKIENSLYFATTIGESKYTE